jgi:hypothetical protein
VPDDDRPIEDPSPEDAEKKKDLRYSAFERSNVRVDRELDGSGRLARGDHTKMSVLNFSSRHAARTERDPDFEFRPAPAKPAEAVAPPVVEPAPPAPAAAASPEAGDESLVDRFKRILGL